MKSILLRGPVFSASGYGEHTRFVLRCLRPYQEEYDIYVQPIPWGRTAWEIQSNEEGQWLKSLADKLIFDPPQGQVDYCIQVTIPTEFEPMGKINIGCTAGIESDKVSAEWIQKCNMMDKVIVVSEHAKYGFENTVLPGQGGQDLKITTPIDVVNYPVKNICPDKLDIDFDTEFNFLCMALFGPRKNLENTIRWFVEKFKDIILINRINPFEGSC